MITCGMLLFCCRTFERICQCQMMSVADSVDAKIKNIKYVIIYIM